MATRMVLACDRCPFLSKECPAMPMHFLTYLLGLKDKEAKGILDKMLELEIWSFYCVARKKPIFAKL